jgi:hypothetical protein
MVGRVVVVMRVSPLRVDGWGGGAP